MKKTFKVTMALLGILLAGFTLQAKQVKMDVSLSQSMLMADKKQISYLKVSLTGFEMSSPKERAPVNIALVIDESGSMSGEKIEKAKEAAILAINKLGPKDIVSVIAYDSTVNVLVPATKVSDKAAIIAKIKQLEAAGNTALYAGVSKGAAEVRKFLDKNHVNRVILISDGQANVGASSPGELAELGRSFAKDQMSVTTIGLGLGYNEDLMSQLAAASDGNHAFAESASDLVKLFNYEFKDVLSVVAQEIQINIKCDAGVRPVKVLGRQAEIVGQEVRASLNQLYSNHEKYLILEIEVPPGAANSSRKIATVDVSYGNMETKTTDKLSNAIEVAFSGSEKSVLASKDKKVLVDVIVQTANATNKEALKLRDEGKIEEAEQVLSGNIIYLEGNVKGFGGAELQKEREKLKKISKFNILQKDQVKEKSKSSWSKFRKAMKKKQYEYDSQQKY